MSVQTAAGVDVELSWPELRHAAYLGLDRYVRALVHDRATQHGQHRDDSQHHVLGAWGECVVAKLTDTYWSETLGRPDGGTADVCGLHVRTGARVDHSLLLHDEDDDDGQYVLVVIVRLPVFRVCGWLYGRDGKQPEHWQTFTGRPAYFVPQSALRPIESLP